MVIRISKIKLNYFNLGRLVEIGFIFITLFNLFWVAVERRIPYGTIIGTCVSIVIILLEVAYKGKQIKFKDVFLYVFWAIVCLINALIFTSSLMMKELPNYIFFTTLMFFAGILIDFSKNEKIIYVLSVIYMSSNLIYMLFVFTGNRNMLTDGIDYMSFSYQALFSVLILIYYALKKKMLIYYAIAGVGCLYILMCGTRGPIICIMVYLLIYFLTTMTRNITTGKLIRYLLLFAFAFVLVLNIRNIASFLYPIFQEKHVSTRILMYLLNDSSGLDTSGRDSIYGTVLIGIGKNFFTGIGLMNDRNLLGGLYTHNLILEILLSFGVFFGGVILLAIFYLIFKAYQKTKNTDLFPYMCIFFSCTIVKLMISGSFIAEPLLYMFFGFCVSSIRRSRLKDTEHSLQKGFGGKSYV